MRHHRYRRLPGVIVALVVPLLLAAPAWAQFDAQPRGVLPDPLGQAVEEPVVAMAAQFTKPAADKPAELFITARIKPGWHIYSITQPAAGPAGGPMRSQLKLAENKQFKLSGPFDAVPAPDKKTEPAFDNLVVETHHGTVVWHAPIQLAEGVDPKKLEIQGNLYAQPCDAGSCLRPQHFPFTASLGSGVELPKKKSDKKEPEKKKQGSAAAAAPAPSAGPPAQAVGADGLLVKLGLAFLGGLILNLMPCVLPVISLKLLSFLEQAGESRGRVFELNLWYAVGLLSVFMVLASFAVLAGHAWGEQFTLPWFKIGLTALVFVMALSFLGVWEIPIPGFVGSGQLSQLQTKEGAAGSFFKGVFATVLATPCSGPFLGPLFGFLLYQPPYVAYLIFGAVGLGMAFPYLVIGAFPELIRFMPKPGAWMDTFKQLMGFLLLGTVVFLFSTISAAHFVPTLTLLVGLWFACWWIGRTPITAGRAANVTAWVGGTMVAAAIGLFAFTLLLHESKMPWRPFSPEALAQARAEGKTVMVDFTADWCLTCKTNLKLSIDTERVRQRVQENGVLPMLADWTNESPMIKRALNDLGKNSIPVLAVWPADPNAEAIVLTDLLSESEVLDALEEAGPSKRRSERRPELTSSTPDDSRVTSTNEPASGRPGEAHF